MVRGFRFLSCGPEAKNETKLKYANKMTVNFESGNNKQHQFTIYFVRQAIKIFCYCMTKLAIFEAFVRIKISINHMFIFSSAYYILS